MCTAIHYSFGDHYFGRTLDYGDSPDIRVVICPRCFVLSYRNASPMTHHYALIGVAAVAEGFPIYYEATNERGLSMASLPYSGTGCFLQETSGRDNIAAFEVIPWVLGKCASVMEARKLLQRLHIINTPLEDDHTAEGMHWLLADRYGSLVIEATERGIQFYENPVGVLTDGSPLPYQLHRLSEYGGIAPENMAYRNGMPSVAAKSWGLGCLGLPGDYSSGARFLRAAYLSHNTHSDGTESSNVNQFFRLMEGVSVPRGAVTEAKGRLMHTRYTCCCNTDRGIYYYTTYENCRITSIVLRNENLFRDDLIVYPLNTQPDFFWNN